MGISALISAILGLISGMVPKAFDTYNKAQDHKREMDVRAAEMKFRELDHKLAMERVKAEAAVKIDETYYQAAAEEAKAAGERMVEMIRQQFSPTGTPWIDNFNAIVRPMCALVILGMFVTSVLSFMFGATTINAEFARSMSGLFTLSVEAVLGFVFGYRSAMARPAPR